MVQEILTPAAPSLNEIDALAFQRGPKQLTGVRIGGRVLCKGWR